jgi:hypothetical protein
MIRSSLNVLAAAAFLLGCPGPPLAAQEADPVGFGPPAAGDALKITGPAVTPPYRLVRLTLEGLPVAKGSAFWDAVGTDGGGYFAADGQEVEQGRYFIFAGPPGQYAVTATYMVDGVLGRARFLATIGHGPNPPPVPPNPGPRPDPNPTPDPQPGPVAGPLYVVVIEETAEAVAERGVYFGNGPLGELMRAKGHKWRVVDKDVVGPDGKPPADVARFLDAAHGKRMPQLFLVDGRGRTVHAGDLPPVADLMRLLGG